MIGALNALVSALLVNAPAVDELATAKVETTAALIDRTLKASILHELTACHGFIVAGDTTEALSRARAALNMGGL